MGLSASQLLDVPADRNNPSKLSGFLGYSANAIRWQVWTSLLVQVLLRSYGTAGGSFKLLGAAQQAWLPGFRPFLT
jgi:hypothetical protein